VADRSENRGECSTDRVWLLAALNTRGEYFGCAGGVEGEEPEPRADRDVVVGADGVARMARLPYRYSLATDGVD